MFKCPGCNGEHAVDDKTWQFNGSFDSPTFQPSILYLEFMGPKDDSVSHVCHSYVTGGKIRFLDDCTHELKGQTVELPEVK